ncbi:MULTISPECIES: hypothetical protein [Hydrocarboniphaga]|uniref:hypothetical protein n=1 Tax=Hydrocarboniphaga TaxID=243627 RepID=UPI0012F9823C|nr:MULTISPECIES: hypothetical protein [Hydrocarboniphaga]MDZ4077872.1 hypothetical protein [Hydrocarboniphaga sp.]
MYRILSALAAAFLLIASSANAAPNDEAKKLFERYVALEHAFDPEVADLYADDALIKNRRTYPTGQVRELTMPAPQYKALIRQSMPLAKAKGDTSSYSDITYSQEDSGVRVRATRFSNLKKYSSPVSLLAAPNADGLWRIREELSESQP